MRNNYTDLIAIPIGNRTQSVLVNDYDTFSNTVILDTSNTFESNIQITPSIGGTISVLEQHNTISLFATESIQAVISLISEITTRMFPIYALLEAIKSNSPNNTPIQTDYVIWIKENIHNITYKRIGEMVGVSRQAIHDWLKGKVIATSKKKRLFDVVDILKLAAQKYDNPIAMEKWLFSSITPEGESPFALLKSEEFDRARFYAFARIPSTVKHFSINRTSIKKYQHTPEYFSEPFLPDESMDYLLLDNPDTDIESE